MNKKKKDHFQDKIEEWQQKIKEYAINLLKSDPSPDIVLQYRLRKEILFKDTTTSELENLKQQLDTNIHVQTLKREQNFDGGWSKFHNMNDPKK